MQLHGVARASLFDLKIREIEKTSKGRSIKFSFSLKLVIVVVGNLILYLIEIIVYKHNLMFYKIELVEEKE